MTIRLVAQDIDGRDYLIETTSVGGSNVVLDNVDCNSSVYVGAVVRLDATGTAINALADSLANSNVIGICEFKPSLNKCNIRVLGVTIGDIFTGLDVTKEYYLSSSIAGAITHVPPTTSGHVMLKIGQPFTDKSMLMLKGQRIVRL